MSSRALIVLVLAQLVLLASAPPLFARTAYYVEVQDPFTRVTGLKELLEHLGYTPRELKARQLSRSLPPRAIVVIGSFATADPAVRRELQHAKRAITRFLEGGGTLIQLTQAHKHEGRIPWLPAALAATRGDFDYERPVVIHPDHPLFRAKTALFSACSRFSLEPESVATLPRPSCFTRSR